MKSRKNCRYLSTFLLDSIDLIITGTVALISWCFHVKSLQVCYKLINLDVRGHVFIYYDIATSSISQCSCYFFLLILTVVQVPGVVSPSQLPVLLASVQEELDSSEWGVRKAAADTLSSMATAAGTALASYRGSVLAALENGRFDKVNVVLFMVN